MAIAGECVCLLIAYWFLFMGGNEALHLPEGHYDRRVVLFAVSLATFLRMGFMVAYLLRRGMRWGEVGGVLFAFAGRIQRRARTSALKLRFRCVGAFPALCGRLCPPCRL